MLTKQQEAVLSTLRRAGARGITAYNLVMDSQVLGYRQRVSELRQKGYEISCRYAGRSMKTDSSIYQYILKACPA